MQTKTGAGKMHKGVASEKNEPGNSLKGPKSRCFGIVALYCVTRVRSAWLLWLLGLPHRSFTSTSLAAASADVPGAVIVKPLPFDGRSFKCNCVRAIAQHHHRHLVPGPLAYHVVWVSYTPLPSVHSIPFDPPVRPSPSPALL